jgi:hypothetical protein
MTRANILDSGYQVPGIIRQEEEQDASKNLLADVGVCGFVTLGGEGLSRMTGSNGVIFCCCWQDIMPTLFATLRLCNLHASFELSGFASVGKQETETNNFRACILYLVKNNNNQLAIYFTSLDKGSTSGW